MKVIMFEFILSIMVSFLFVGVDRRFCRCSATLLFWGEDIPMLSFLFRRCWDGGVEDGLDVRQIRLGSSKVNALTSEDVSQWLIQLTSIDGVDMSVTSITSSCFRLGALLAGGNFATVISVGDNGIITLMWLRGKFKSLRLRGMIDTCLP